MKNKLKDSSEMPWGKHKGELMANIPASYFVYIWDNKMCGNGSVYIYILENLEDLRNEA